MCMLHIVQLVYRGKPRYGSLFFFICYSEFSIVVVRIFFYFFFRISNHSHCLFSVHISFVCISRSFTSNKSCSCKLSTFAHTHVNIFNCFSTFFLFFVRPNRFNLFMLRYNFCKTLSHVLRLRMYSFVTQSFRVCMCVCVL